jgi:ABC-type proline/glycine betaine transport system permease subunit
VNFSHFSQKRSLKRLITAFIALAIVVGLLLLVVFAPWVAAAIFLILLACVFFLRILGEGFWRAVVKTLKDLLTGW